VPVQKRRRIFALSFEEKPSKHAGQYYTVRLQGNQQKLFDIVKTEFKFVLKQR